MPITESDQLKYKNEMAWVVDDPYMDNICGLKETEIECNIPHQDPIHPRVIIVYGNQDYLMMV